MKTLKPLLLVIAGIAMAFLLSFKSDEPVKEYATLQMTMGAKNQIQIFIKNEPSEIFLFKYNERSKTLNNKINELSQQGWKLVSASSHVSQEVLLFFEREK